MFKLNLDKNKKYLLACSFGPDSMALFKILIDNKYHFACAIVNYHLRKESDEEVIHLKEFALRFNIPVYVHDVKEKISKNVEAVARDIRYRFFSYLCQTYNFDAVLVAHHQDDLIETYLMQKNRQNFPICYGIAEKSTINSIEVYRPLLSYKKEDLLKFCQINNVPYSIDKSNFDKSIIRNRFRHDIVEKLSHDERLEIIKTINNENKLLSQMFSNLNFDKLNDIKYILSIDLISQCYALNYLVKKLGYSRNLSKKNVGHIIQILKSRNPNGQYVIHHSLFLIKEYEQFVFSLQKIEEINYSYVLSSPLELDTPFFYLNFTEQFNNRNVKADDFPLTIRNICRDDYLIINGYKSTSQRLMIDWKVPFRKRLYWPVILNKNGIIIYIPRYKKEFIVTQDCNFYVK